MNQQMFKLRLFKQILEKSENNPDVVTVSV